MQMSIRISTLKCTAQSNLKLAKVLLILLLLKERQQVDKEQKIHAQCAQSVDYNGNTTLSFIEDH
jgi:hypothetical protein